MDCFCASHLTRLVDVEKISTSATVDANGNIDETNDANWVKFGSEWVGFVTKGSREFFRGRQVNEDVTHQVTLRWSQKSAQYTTGMRLKMDGRKFNISAPPINIDEKNEWIQLETKEVPAV